MVFQIVGMGSGILERLNSHGYLSAANAPPSAAHRLSASLAMCSSSILTPSETVETACEVDVDISA